MVGMNEYGRLFVRLNGHLRGRFAAFHFLAGMGFGEPEKWWSGNGKRPRPHEGVDIRFYRDQQKRLHCFGEKTKVPFFRAGKVVAITKDFLADSVFVREKTDDVDQFITVYSHILPAVECGADVKKGDVVGMIAAVSGAVPAHLHVSVLRLQRDIAPENLHWDFLSRCGSAIFANPFSEKS